MAAISQTAVKHMGIDVLRYLLRDDNRPKRHIAARKSLGRGDNVRLNSIMLRGQPFTRSSKSAHHLVINQKNTVAVAECAQFRIVVIGRDEKAVGARDAFDEYGCDATRALHLDDLFDVGDALAMAVFDLLAKRAPVAVWVEGSHDAGDSGLDWPAARIA